MRFRITLSLVCLLVGVALATSPVEAAKNHKNFVLHNDSGVTINSFQFIPSGVDSWGPNQLAEPLRHNYWIWNKHNNWQRYYHMRLFFEEGTELVLENVDLTEVLRIFVYCDDEECWAEYGYE